MAAFKTSAGAIFITFSGNCKKALSFYQTCFGGLLQFEVFGKGAPNLPVICGSLVSESIVIHGSDLVHDEGRNPGNHMAIFLPCKSPRKRLELLKKLEPKMKHSSITMRITN